MAEPKIIKAGSRNRVCISCQKDVVGRQAYPVREDRVIKVIRAIKNFFRVAQNNELYVCSDCVPKHSERRKSFEKSMLFASIFAGLILVVLIVAMFLSGRPDLWAVVSAFIIAGFVLMLPLFKYAPAVEGMPALSVMPLSPPPPMPQPPIQPAPQQPVQPAPAVKAKKKKK